jgi:hypothetical protein
MTNCDDARRIEIKDGDETVAVADVARLPDGTARASVHPKSGHAAPGHRASLVDAVVELPEVRESQRLEASIPVGDTETLHRLHERTEATSTRPAGSTALVDGDVPVQGGPGGPRQPGPPAP